MSNPPYKRLEVADRFSPEKLATFTRPREDHDTIIIEIHNPGEFHLDAGTLRVVAEVLHKNH